MKKQIKCINKSDRPNPHERITHCGGDGWKKTQEQIISDIEKGTEEYFVKVAGYREVKVIVAVSAAGNKYIRTTEDDEKQNNLLSLPQCP